jgi:hypothetical protein
MRSDEAVRKAEQVARDKGWALDDYETPTAELKDGRWTVRFEGRRRAPGNHFVVQVDDATGEATLWPGR